MINADSARALRSARITRRLFAAYRRSARPMRTHSQRGRIPAIRQGLGVTDSSERDANHPNEPTEGACNPAHQSSDDDLSHTGPAWLAFASPLAGVINPRLSSAWMLAAPTWAFCLSCVAHLALLAAGIVAVFMWDAMYRDRPFDPPGWNAPDRSGYTVVHFDSASDPCLIPRSWDDVWRYYHANGAFGPIEFIFLSTFAVALLLALFAAWMFLPHAYRGGSFARCLCAVFRAVASCAGLLIVLAFGVFVLGFLARRIDFALPGGRRGGPLVVAVVFACLSLIIFWIVRAVDAIQLPRPSKLAPPPRCEQCGYDLTHRPADGRCTECGLAIQLSLTPGAIRREQNWEKIGGNSFSLDRISAIVLRPSEFYRTALIRTSDDDARRFARRLYITIAVCAALWNFSMFMLVAPIRDANVAFILSAMMLFIVPLVGWFVQRVVAAIVVTWWAYNSLLDDFRWARKVIAYETAYLWVFCLFNGVAISVAIMGRTPAWASGSAYFGIVWLPIGIGLFLLGNLALIASWFWRYRLAGRAIRWNNF